MMTLDVVAAFYEASTKKKFSEKAFSKFMFGQTCSIIGGQRLYYLCDVLRFINNQPVVD